MEDILISESKLKNNVKINIGGYKHVFVTVISAALASNITATLYNVPDIFDTYQIIGILRKMGKKIDFKDKQLKIYKGDISYSHIDEDMGKYIHGSIYLFIALVIACKKGSMYNSGGCSIGNEKNGGTRPEHHFLKVMERFGINVTFDNDNKKLCSYSKLKAVRIDINQFKGDNNISSNLHSGATKAAILCSIGVNSGKTQIVNPYLKPDVTELLEFLKKVGYKIDLMDNMIQIEYGENKNDEIYFKIMPDISEIISFISFSVFNEINIDLLFDQVDKVKYGLKKELDYLKVANVPYVWKDSGLVVLGDNKSKMHPFSITVTSSSIFSDSQPFFSIIALKCSGISTIKEGIWISRFDYANEAIKLGYPFNIIDNTIKIYPWDKTINTECTEVIANDLRASFALITLSLNRKKPIVIKNFYHIHRGYENIYEKFLSLGINFKVF